MSSESSSVRSRHATPKRLLATALGLAMTAGSATVVHAGTVDPVPADPQHATRLKGVDVQASTLPEPASPKFTAPLLDTPQTVDIIGSDLIAKQGATTLAEALRNSPGVGTFYVGENGSTSTGDAIYMRGFDSSGSIFVDGVRDLGSISRDMFDIEQIEVTKGPAGTDYGRTAPTGSVNLVTKQPNLDDRLAASASYGSNAQRRVTADWNRAFGRGAAFRLNLVDQDSGVPGRDAVANKRWGVAPTLAFGLDSATRVYLDYLHVKQDNLPDGGVPTIGLPGYSSPDPTRPAIGTAPMVDPANFYGTDADHDDVTVDMATARIEHDVGDSALLRNTTRWGRTAQDYLLTSFKGDAAGLLTPDPADPATWTLARSNPTFKHQVNRILTNQTNLSAQLDSGRVHHSLSAGIELTREQLATVGMGALDGSAWPAANLYRPDRHVGGLQWGDTGARSHGRTDTVAAYLFDTMQLSEHWQATAGVRLDHYSTDFHDTAACGSRRGPVCGDLPAGSIVPDLDTRIAGNLPSWKLGIVYKPTPIGSIYANFAVAQQPPGGSSLELSSSANNANNPAFDPQKARTTELGSKWSLLGDRLLLTGALYRTVVDNEVVQDPVDQLYYQTGRKRVQGIELGATGKLTARWAVTAGFTTMDAKVVDGGNVAEDGSRDLAYTPKSAFTAWTTYRLPCDLTFGGGARYSGAMKRGTDGAIGTPAFTEAYWVFDAMASYPLNRHLDLQLNVYNLFDEDYVAAINKSGYRYTPGAPRSVMLTANVRF
jgi:catecholate siderophore receptor